MLDYDAAYVRQRNWAVARVIVRFLVRHWYMVVPITTLLALPLWTGVLATVLCVAIKVIIRRFQKLQDAAIRIAFGDPLAYKIFRTIAASWNKTMIRQGLAPKRANVDGLGLRAAYLRVAVTRRIDSYLREVANGADPADYDVPGLLDGRPSTLGLDLRVRLLPHQTLNAFESRAGSLTTEWAQLVSDVIDQDGGAVRVESVRVERSSRGMGEVVVRVAYRDPLATGREFMAPQVEAPGALSDVASLPSQDEGFRRLPGSASPATSLEAVTALPVGAVEVGICEDGTPWFFRLDQTSSVIGGVPGSGKSVLLNRILAGVAPNPRIQVVGIDCKGGVELWDWNPRLSALAEDQESARPILEKIDQLGARRLQGLKISASKSLSRCGYTLEEPMIVLVIDEASELFMPEGPDREDKARASALVTLVSRIVRLYRAAGIFVVTATQKPTVESLPSLIRDNSTQKVAFRCTTPEQAMAILGDGIRGSDVLPTRLADSQKGYAVISNVDGEYSYARGDFISEGSSKNVAHATAHLAVPLDNLVRGGLHTPLVSSPRTPQDV